MQTHKLRINSRQLHAFLKELEALPDEASGPHLADAEFAGYVVGTLSEQETQQTDTHLQSCQQCCQQMEQLLEADRWDNHFGDSSATSSLQTLPHSRHMASPQSAVRAAISLAGLEETGLRRLLLRWASLLSFHKPGAFTVNQWRPASVGGFLAPTQEQTDPLMNRRPSSHTPETRSLHVNLSPHFEIVEIDIPVGNPSTLNVIVKGEHSNSHILLLPIMMGRNNSRAQAVRAVSHHTLPYFQATFEGVEAGSYFIAYLPQPSEEIDSEVEE